MRKTIVAIALTVISVLIQPIVQNIKTGAQTGFSPDNVLVYVRGFSDSGEFVWSTTTSRQVVSFPIINVQPFLKRVNT